MNERIRELAEQAGGEFYEGFAGSTNFVNFAEDDFKKFAELIVRECASIVAKRKNQAIDDGWNVDEAMSMAEMDFLEHFGVEE
jgi:hypothetical protein